MYTSAARVQTRPRGSASCTPARRGSGRDPPLPDRSRSVEGRHRGMKGTPGWPAPLARERQPARQADPGRTSMGGTCPCPADPRERCPDDAGPRRRRSRSMVQTTRPPGRVRRPAARADPVPGRGPERARPPHGSRRGGRTPLRSSGTETVVTDLLGKPVDPARGEADGWLRGSSTRTGRGLDCEEK